MLHLTPDNANKIESSTNPVVIDCYATWCGPCMKMKPIFEELAQDLSDSYTFAMLNVDECKELSIKYDITSIPTILFIKDGAVIGREMGFMKRDDLRSKIKQHCE